MTSLVRTVTLLCVAACGARAMPTAHLDTMLSMQLFDGSGRHVLAHRDFVVFSSEPRWPRFHGTTDERGLMHVLDVPSGDYTLCVEHVYGEATLVVLRSDDVPQQQLLDGDAIHPGDGWCDDDERSEACIAARARVQQPPPSCAARGR